MGHAAQMQVAGFRCPIIEQEHGARARSEEVLQSERRFASAGITLYKIKPLWGQATSQHMIESEHACTQAFILRRCNVRRTEQFIFIFKCHERCQENTDWPHFDQS